MDRLRLSVCVAYVEGWIRTVAVAGSVRGCGHVGRCIGLRHRTRSCSELPHLDSC